MQVTTQIHMHIELHVDPHHDMRIECQYANQYAGKHVWLPIYSKESKKMESGKRDAHKKVSQPERTGQGTQKK